MICRNVSGSTSILGWWWFVVVWTGWSYIFPKHPFFYSSFSSNLPGAKPLKCSMELYQFRPPNTQRRHLPLLLWDSYSMGIYCTVKDSPLVFSLLYVLYVYNIYVAGYVAVQGHFALWYPYVYFICKYSTGKCMCCHCQEHGCAFTVGHMAGLSLSTAWLCRHCRAHGWAVTVNSMAVPSLSGTWLGCHCQIAVYSVMVTNYFISVLKTVVPCFIINLNYF